MKSVLLGLSLAGALAVGVSVTPSEAADLGPARAAPAYMAPAAVWQWAGAYVGIEGGGGWGTSQHTDPTGFDSGSFDLSGGLVGGTLGYNWQVHRFVFGLEGDMSWADIGGSTPGLAGNTCGGFPSHCGTDLEWLATARVRLGYAYGRFLPYLTGGVAFGSVHGDEGDVAANGAFGSGSSVVAGWTVGVGLEAKLSENWSAKIEYLHVDLGKNHVFNDNNVVALGTLTPESVGFSADIIRVGLNYRFW